MTATAPADRWLEYVPLSKVQPAKRNPKRHADEDIDASVGRFGYTEPVLLDERTGRLVAGHGRLTTLRTREQRGEAPPDGIRVNPDTGEWEMPVVRGWRSENDDEAEGYLVASNRLTSLGDWSLPELHAILSEQPSLAGIGYTDREVAALSALLSYDYSAADDAADQAAADAAAAASWPEIRIKVPHAILGRWRDVPAEDDLARLVKLLDSYPAGDE